MLCERCNKRPTEYTSPGKWCELCWADWWFLGDMEGYTQEEIEKAKKERAEFLREYHGQSFKIN